MRRPKKRGKTMQNKAKQTLLFTLAVSAAISSHAHGAFLWEQSQPEPEKTIMPEPKAEIGTAEPGALASSGLGGQPVSLLTQPKGTEDLENAMYRGFGTALPLSIALKQIPPKGINVEAGYGVDEAELVSWSGNKPWKEALQEAAGPTLTLSKLSDQLYLLAQRIDTPESPMQASTPVTGTQVAEVALPDEPNPVGTGKSDSAEKILSDAPKNPFENVVFDDEIEIPKIEACPDWVGDPGPKRTWTASAGQKLEDVLREWAAIGAAKPWTLIWNTNRVYPITADAEFEGYFCEATSLIVTAFRNDNHPPRGSGSQKNNVFVVTTLDDMENN